MTSLSFMLTLTVTQHLRILDLHADLSQAT